MIEKLVKEYIVKNNFVDEYEAIDDSFIGLKIFGSPIVGYASADDELFNKYKSEYEIMYNQFMMPKEWLDSAKTVISIFFPYTSEVKKSNSIDKKMPSKEWLHGRYEGQKIINNCCKYIVSKLISEGYSAVSPTIDDRLNAVIGTHLENQNDLDNTKYNSNWSERHIAFIAGLGTFGLSKGLITAKGVAGRFASIITNYEHDTTKRAYKGIYENCTMCGECIAKCPVKAITFEGGKDHTKCSRLVDYTLTRYNPRYACGKCQVGVPCESNTPILDI